MTFLTNGMKVIPKFKIQISKISDKKKKRVGLGFKRESKTKIMEIAGDDGYVYTVKKKVRYTNFPRIFHLFSSKIDPNEPDFIRIPPMPMPLSWAKTIAPYQPPFKAKGSSYYECDILKSDLIGLVKPNKFIGMLIDLPWSSVFGGKKSVAKEIGVIPFSKLVPNGYIFMWVEKEVISEVKKYFFSD